MKEGLEKKLMLDLLKYPAEVFYKDDNIAVLIPTGMESLVYHLGSGNGKNGFVNSVGQHALIKNIEDAYVVATRNGDRILVRTTRSGTFGSTRIFLWDYTHLDESKLIKKYPSLKDAFDKAAKEINYLPLIKHHTKEVIAEAIRKDPANIRYVENMTVKDKKYWVRQKSATFEFMLQCKELVQFAMANTDIGLGEISSHYVTATIAKQGVRKNPHDLRYVPKQHQTPELLKYAVQQDPGVLRHITHPTTDLYVAAVRSGKNAWDFVPESMRKKVKKLV